MLATPAHPNLTTKGILGYGLRQPGRANGNLGSHSHFNQDVRLPGGAATTQTEGLYTSDSVRTFADPRHGDRADFDGVEDNLFNEGIRGADASLNAAHDWMVWSIGPTMPSGHINPEQGPHVHGFWGELVLPDFAGPFFQYVDVVSQIGRYSDMDIASREWSRRNSALDYDLDFSWDGVNWFDGDPIRVFIPGWNLFAGADDYVARWLSPRPARFVRAGGLMGDGHDGNVQIDAIIAGYGVPEPVTLAFAGIGLVLIGFARHKRKIPE